MVRPAPRMRRDAGHGIRQLGLTDPVPVRPGIWRLPDRNKCPGLGLNSLTRTPISMALTKDPDANPHMLAPVRRTIKARG